MPGFRHGARRGLVLVGGAFLAALFVARVLPLVAADRPTPDWLVPALGVAVVVSLGLTLKASKYWSYAYLGGFVLSVGLALAVLLQAPFIGAREVLLYGGAAVGAVLLRVTIHL